MEAVLRIYGVLVFLRHGFKGQAGASGPGFGGGGRGPVRFRPDAQIDEADQDVHVDESVSLHRRPCDESILAATGWQEARRKLTIDRRYCAVVAGTCRCENARDRTVGAPRQMWAVGLATFVAVVVAWPVVIGRWQPRWSADVVHPYAVSREIIEAAHAPSTSTLIW